MIVPRLELRANGSTIVAHPNSHLSNNLATGGKENVSLFGIENSLLKAQIILWQPFSVWTHPDMARKATS